MFQIWLSIFLFSFISALTLLFTFFEKVGDDEEEKEEEQEEQEGKKKLFNVLSSRDKSSSAFFDDLNRVEQLSRQFF